MSLINILTEDWSDIKSQKIKKLLNFFEKRIKKDSMSYDEKSVFQNRYVGAGVFKTVYKYNSLIIGIATNPEHPENKILYADYQKLMNNKIKNIVNIYFVDPEHGVVVTEFLPKILRHTEYTLTKGLSYWKYFDFHYNDQSTEEFVNDQAKRYKYDNITDEDIKYANQLINGMKELKELGIKFKDIHPSNVGFDRRGVLKIFDW